MKSALVLTAGCLGVALMGLAWAADPALAQPVSNVTGRVIDAFSMAPIAGAVVEGGGLRVSTGADGTFALLLPRGAVRLVVTADRHLPERVDVTVAEPAIQIEVLLLDQSQFSENVVVTAGATPIAVPPSTIAVSPLEVRSIAGAAENVFRALQTLPGVSATEDFGSRLAVRGGGPDQNLTIMDGVEIHDPYRLFGLTSAFNPETVESFELTAGGFSPKYGDRLSSILLVQNRSGTQSTRLAGTFSLGLTDANAIVEGKLPGAMDGSWLLTMRRTYYDLVAERFTKSKLPQFGDIQAKGMWDLRPGQRLTVFALRSRESTDAQFSDSTKNNQVGFQTGTQTDLMSVSFFSTIGARFSSRTIGSYYRYVDGLGIDGSFRNESARSNAPGDSAFGRASVVFTRDLAVRDDSVRQELTFKLTPRQLVEAGFEAHALKTSWNWRITGDRNTSEANGSSARGGVGLPALLDSRNDAARAGAWLMDSFQVSPRVEIQPGVRVDWSQMAHETAVSPRVAANVDLGGGYRLRGAMGLFTQSPGYEKLLQSDYFVDLTSAGATGLRSERAVHVLGSLERVFAPGLSARVEGYYKSFTRLIVGRRETPAETAARVALYDFPAELASSIPTAPQITSTPVNGAAGRAYGFDIYVTHQPSSSSEHIAGWAAYTWGRADITAYGRRYPFDYDRRHAVSLVGLFRMKRWFELGATVRVASGFPYTPVTGLRVASTSVPDPPGSADVRYVPQRDVNGLYVWTTDPGGVENLNSARLPVFARVDLRATFKPRWSSSRWQFYVEVINALNRNNAGGIDTTLAYNPDGDRPLVTYTRRGGLPRLPSLGIRFRF
jgi:hypothetical protein